MRILILAGLILLAAAAAFAQPEVVWERAYGGGAYDQADGIVQTSDGGFVFGGRNCSATPGNCDFWLSRITAQGETVWSRTYPHTGDEVCETMIGIPDGYLLTGSTTGSSGNMDFFLLRTNLNGELVWMHSYGGPGTDYPSSVVACADGGFLLAGYTTSFGTGGRDFYAVRTNGLGDTVWTRTYGGPNTDVALSACPVEDGFLLAGYTTSYGSGDWDVYAVRINAQGNPLWTRTYGGTGRDFAESVKHVTAGGFIMGGVTGTASQGYSDLYLVRTNENGDAQWTRSYGTAGADAAMDIVTTPDGGFFAAGCSFNATHDGWMVRTDAGCQIVWSRNFGGAGEDWLLNGLVTNDGGYVAVGFTSSIGHGDADGWVIRIAPEQGPPPGAHFLLVPPTGLPYAIVVDSALVDGAPLLPGDEIGVFDQGLCVGAAPVGEWPLTITAWQGDSEHELAGFTPGHAMLFRVWMRPVDVDVAAQATFTVGNGNFGSGIYSRVSLGSIARQQLTLPLRANYAELVSLNIRLEAAEASAIFGALPSLVAVYAGDGRVLIPPDVNTIGTLEPSAAYRVFCTAPETLRVDGLPQSANHEYPLAPHVWNWIGYPLAVERPVAAGLAGIAEHVLIIQNDNGAAWIPALEINTLGSLLPGEGYMIMVDVPCVLHFTPGGVAAGQMEDPMGTSRPADAPRATGLPYQVVIHMSAALQALQPHKITLCDGAQNVGKGYASGARSMITAWQGLPDFALEGYVAGHPIVVQIETVDGRTLPARISGKAGVYGQGPYQEIFLESATAEPLPAEFAVGAAYPNPFNPTVAIPFDLPQDGRVDVALHNTLGQVVFQHSAFYPAGAHVFTLSTTDVAPGLVSGVYFARIRFNGQSHLQKLVLLK